MRIALAAILIFVIRIRTVVLGLLVGDCCLGLAGAAAHHTNAQTGPSGPFDAAGCTRPAPTTPAGYTRMFAALPVGQWGAADGGVSVPFYGKSVWLFGDTFEAHKDGLAHSTAIVQDRGCLHVSHAGAQLLPDDDPMHVYWMEGGQVIDRSHLAITGRSVVLNGSGVWDFADGGYDRTALVSVSAAGDLTFVRWIAKYINPPPNQGPMLDCEAPAPATPGHICYSEHAHPELRLSGGHILDSTSQNWTDSVWHGWNAYRLIFSQS